MNNKYQAHRGGGTATWLVRLCIFMSKCTGWSVSIQFLINVAWAWLVTDEHRVLCSTGLACAVYTAMAWQHGPGANRRVRICMAGPGTLHSSYTGLACASSIPWLNLHGPSLCEFTNVCTALARVERQSAPIDLWGTGQAARRPW